MCFFRHDTPIFNNHRPFWQWQQGSERDHEEITQEMLYNISWACTSMLFFTFLLLYVLIHVFQMHLFLTTIVHFGDDDDRQREARDNEGFIYVYIGN